MATVRTPVPLERWMACNSLPMFGAERLPTGGTLPRAPSLSKDMWPAQAAMSSRGAVLAAFALVFVRVRWTKRASLRRGCARLRAVAPGDSEPPASAWDKAVWNAAEALGNLRAAVVGESVETAPSEGSLPARSPEELISRLREDYDRNYFLTGDIDVELYAEDCEFSDPFAGFRGRERFVRNLRNLTGGFITDYRVKMLDFDKDGAASGSGSAASGQPCSQLAVRSRLRVVLELGLPWRPVLGWVWGVTHECKCQEVGEFGKVWRCVAHREAWEIDPAEGVSMLFRPSKGLPPAPSPED